MATLPDGEQQLLTTHRVIHVPFSIEQVEDLRPSYSTAEELIFLLKQIRANDPTLRQIDLERKRLPATYLKALFSVLAANKYVTRLRLAKAGVTDQVAGAVAEFLRCNCSVTDLDLTKNGLTDSGCTVLAAALKTTQSSTSNGALRCLILEGNQISNVGVQALCEALPGTDIHVLKLGKIPIGDVGVQAIAALLQLPNCPLRKLDLRSCSLDDAGASVLAEALKTNTSLQSLYLGRNSIGNAAVKDFAAALQHNTVLQTIDLQYNEFSVAGAIAFVKCLETSNDSFQKLKLGHCDAVSDAMKEQLHDLLLVNSHGPDLAQKTKKALRSLLLEESFSERSGWLVERSSSFYDESSTSCNFDGGSDGILREVPPASTSVCNAAPEDCVICFDVPAECALLPCKHRNCCASCAKKLKTCHMCRETVVKVLSRRPIQVQRNENEESIDFRPTTPNH